MKRSDKYLYFWKMGGAGIISCLECNYKQKIVSFLHGFDWNNTGYQCQECGKFHEIICDSDITIRKRCDCGGHLSRSKPIFCPHCKMTKVTYQMSYIT
jgi:hypothetical protein